MNVKIFGLQEKKKLFLISFEGIGMYRLLNAILSGRKTRLL